MTVTSTAPRVLVYGASGYTGRLVCEYLREYRIPFVAAGRSKETLRTSMEGHVPGIETAEYEVVEVDHDVEDLTSLLDGIEVVCNTVGPFAELGPAMVEACLTTGTHYTDTTGEQDWLIRCDTDWGAAFAERGLLLAPGIAHMYTTGEIAAQLALETPGMDTLDIAVFWGGSPTVASTATILINAAMSKAYHLQQNAYVEWDPEAGVQDVIIPGYHQPQLALPWGGTSHPVWFRRDPRVANVKVLGGVFDRSLMMAVPAIVSQAIEQTAGLDHDARYAALSAVAASIRDTMPPRENPRINKSVDSVHASGPLGRVHCAIFGNSNYKQTGLLQAFAANHLLQGAPHQVGFASACQAFGHRELLGALRGFGLVAEPELTVNR